MSTNQSDSIQRPAFKAQTVNDLRELLAQARKMVDDLPGSGARAQTLLFQLDAIQDLFARLKDSGADLRAETTRMEAIESALRSKDFILLRQLEAAGGLAACRAAANPTPEQWWWFLDEGLAQKEKGQKRQTLRTLGIVVAVLLIAVVLYRFVLAPDTSTTRVMDKTSQAEAALKEGDLAGATLAYRQAAEIQPDNPELQAWVGVLEEMQGNTEASAEAYANAERLAGSPAHFYVLRGTARSGAGLWIWPSPMRRLPWPSSRTRPKPTCCWVECMRLKARTVEAMQALQKVVELAEASGNDALVATIKIRLGMFGQRPQLPTISVTASPVAIQ